MTATILRAGDDSTTQVGREARLRPSVSRHPDYRIRSGIAQPCSSQNLRHPLRSDACGLGERAVRVPPPGHSDDRLITCCLKLGMTTGCIGAAGAEALQVLVCDARVQLRSVKDGFGFFHTEHPSKLLGV